MAETLEATPINVIAGIDVGGTNTALGLVDADGQCIREAVLPTLAHQNAELFIERLASAVRSLCEASPAYALRGIGIASPAANAAEGIIDQPANFSWGRVPIAASLRRHFNVPVSVINDSDAALLGEHLYGAARGMHNVLMITLGTGLGAGLLVDGRLVQGANGAAGEFGHMTLVPHGRFCGCGRRGCAETYVSATGLRRTVFELLAHRLEPSDARAVGFNDLTAETVSRYAREGDAIASLAIEQTGISLGMMLANMAAAFDPQAIILAGGLVHAGDILMIPTRRSFDAELLPRYRGKVQLLVSALTDGRAAILGASSLLHTALQNDRVVHVQQHS